jgi:hypothetical protein
MMGLSRARRSGFACCGSKTVGSQLRREIFSSSLEAVMSDNAIDRFDVIVATIDRLVALHRGQPSAEDWDKAVGEVEKAIALAPTVRERLAAFDSPRTRDEIAALGKEIADKMGNERRNLSFLSRHMDVADIMDVLWPYLSRLLGEG